MSSSSSQSSSSSDITDHESFSTPRQDNTPDFVEDINYMPLCKAALAGDWEEATKFFIQYPQTFDKVITPGRETALHLAVRTGRSIDFVEKLLNLMSNDSLKYTNSAHHTVLAVSVIVGNIKAVKLLTEKDPDLLLIEDEDSTRNLPVHFAAKYGHKEMLKNLYQDTIKTCKYQGMNISDFVGEHGVKLLSHLIISDFVDIALDLVKTHPQLATTQLVTTSIDGFSPMELLATKPELFCHKSNLNLWRGLIYTWVPTKMDTLCNSSTTEGQNPPDGTPDSNALSYLTAFNLENPPEGTPDSNGLPYFTTIDLENPPEGAEELEELPHGCHGINTHFPSLRRKLLSLGGTMCYNVKRIFSIMNDKIVPCIKRIQETKSRHHSSVELVRFMSAEIAKLDYPKPMELFELAFMSAAKSGVHEVVEEIIYSFPHAIWFCDRKTKRYVFEEAVMERHANVFNLIHQTSGHKQDVAYSRDADQNNILHLVGKLAPKEKLGSISGAALQMQRELQWFKEVEKLVSPFFSNLLNKEGKKPRTVFTEEHRDLITKGEKWMKSTAGSCSVVAGLIATVVFAAAITVPRFNYTNGHPNFSKKKALTVFAISDSISFLSSIATMLMFASILAARYAEDDFLYALPNRLIIGLFSLWLSITTMTMAFVASIILVFHISDLRLLILLSISISLPVSLFTISHVRLLIDVIRSTYGGGIFRKQSDRIIY